MQRERGRLSRLGNVRRIALGTARRFAGDHMLTFAAALAYHAMLSVFPFVIFLIALLGFVGMPDIFEWLRDRASHVLPQRSFEEFLQIIRQIRETRSGGLISAGILGAI